jgi:phosphoribosylformimino-5-aminoimidazole carboxamide ribotide isomerase
MGFGTLHVIDLDAALESGHNRELIAGVMRATDATTQVGGGVRSVADVEDLLSAGADRVIVGTRAVDERDWLEAMARRHPERIMVAADLAHGEILRRGWTESSGLEAEDFVRGLADVPLAGILCTDVTREGRVQGIDVGRADRIITASAHPVWISGGIHSMRDLDALNAIGAAGAVLGMALYTGLLDGPEVAREFGE